MAKKKKCVFITTSFDNDCANYTGGSKRVFIVEQLRNEETFTLDEEKNLITAINAGVTKVFGVKLRGDQNVFEQESESNDDNGTTVVAQTITFRIFGKDEEKNEQVNKLMKAKPFVIVLDNNGNYEVGGLSGGMTAAITATNGNAKGDFNGYSVTFTANEGDLAPNLSAEAITTLLSLVVPVGADE